MVDIVPETGDAAVEGVDAPLGLPSAPAAWCTAGLDALPALESALGSVVALGVLVHRGAFLLRKKAHLGAPKAITATAHKLARIIYSMLRYGQQYVDAGAEYYERQYRQRALHTARRRAAQLGYQLVPISDVQALDVPHRPELVTA
jgi:hypothetical protein